MELLADQLRAPAADEKDWETLACVLTISIKSPKRIMALKKLGQKRETSLH